MVSERNKTISNIHTFQKLLNDVKEKANIQKWEVEHLRMDIKLHPIKAFFL